MSCSVEPSRRIDAEAGADLGRNEPPVEALAERRRQPVQLLEGAELQSGAASGRQPPAPSPSGAGDDGSRAAPAGGRPQRARARARSSGVLRFMNAVAGSAKRPTRSGPRRRTRTPSKNPVILS